MTTFPLDKSDIQEHLREGLITLGTSEGTPTQRLARAYNGHLEKLETTTLEDLKISDKKIFNDIQKMLSQIKASLVRRGERSFDLSGLDDSQVRKMVGELIKIYGEVCRHLPNL